MLDPDRPWGWRIVNYAYYVKLISRAEKSKYDKKRYLSKKQSKNAIPLSGSEKPCEKGEKHPKKGEKSEIPQNSTDSTHVDVDVDVDVGKEIRQRKKKCPHQKIVDLYHKTLPELRRVEKLNDTRKRYLKNLWDDESELPKLSDWQSFFELIRESDFLMGRAPPGPNRSKPFSASLEWLTKPANYIKIIERNYHDS